VDCFPTARGEGGDERQKCSAIPSRPRGRPFAQRRETEEPWKWLQPQKQASHAELWALQSHPPPPPCSYCFCPECKHFSMQMPQQGGTDLFVTLPPDNKPTVFTLNYLNLQ